MKLPIQLAFISALAIAAPAPAANPADTEIPSRVERYWVDYRLNDDASHVETHEWASKVLMERALEGVKRRSITYSTSIQRAEVLTAYTRKADGRKIEVPKTNYQMEINKGREKDSPLFSDRTTLTVVFPEVQVGDTVVMKYKITQIEPMYPGKFSVQNFFPRAYPYDDVKIRFDVPASLWAQYEAREMREQVEEKGGRKVIEWTFENKTPIRGKRRDYSVYDVEQDPGFAFSTFRSYAEIADAYGQRAQPKAIVTDRVRQLADEIAVGKTKPREQAHALYDWVSTNISYAGNCVGVGAVVPHDIPLILDNRMGDCKDHATLLQALLAAKGIESIQALVNAGSSYKLARIPVASAVNHVINYVPSLDLYVDSTSQSTPFGMLPPAVAGKPVLLVDGLRESAHTPVPTPGHNRQEMKTIATISADGSVRGEVRVSLKGEFAVTTRAWMRKMPKEQEEELVKNVLQGQGYVGSGSLERPDAKALLDSYQYKVKFDMHNFVQRPGAGAFRINPFFYSDAPVAAFVQEAIEPVEDVDVACSSGLSSEEYVYRLPTNMTILAVPDDLAIKNDFLAYRASYKLKGNTLTVKRVFDDRTQGNVCSPAIMKAYRDFAAKAMSNVKAQVVYK